MLIPVRALFRAVLVAAIFFSGTAVAERSFSSRVISCIDGDTVKIQTRQHIRFAGIDTPEKASDTSPAQYYAREARQLTRQLVLNKRIKFVPLPGTGKDRYGRLVVEAFLPDGDSLNERLLREGAAYFYDHRDLPESMRTRFLAAQSAAITQRSGFWKRILESPDARKPFIGNRKSRRFFSIPCSQTVRIARRNFVSFPDLEAAFRQGYAPARFCSIWPDA